MESGDHLLSVKNDSSLIIVEAYANNKGQRSNSSVIGVQRDRQTCATKYIALWFIIIDYHNFIGY